MSYTHILVDRNSHFNSKTRKKMCFKKWLHNVAFHWRIWAALDLLQFDRLLRRQTFGFSCHSTWRWSPPSPASNTACHHESNILSRGFETSQINWEVISFGNTHKLMENRDNIKSTSIKPSASILPTRHLHMTDSCVWPGSKVPIMGRISKIWLMSLDHSNQHGWEFEEKLLVWLRIEILLLGKNYPHMFISFSPKVKLKNHGPRESRIPLKK